MANSRILFVSLLVASCSPADVPRVLPTAAVVAPMPVEYTCQQQRQLAAEVRKLPAKSMIRVAINDYGAERSALRAVLGLPEPAGCPPTPEQ